MGCGASTANANVVASDEPLLQPVSASDEHIPKGDLHSGEEIHETEEKTEEVQQIIEEVAPEPVVEEPSPMEIAASQYKDYLVSQLEADPIKFSFDRVFSLPFAPEYVWPVVSDWTLEYLTTYSPKIKVSTSVEPNFPELLCRDIRLPNGEFHEVLTFVDNEKMEYEYIATSGPIPFKNHLVHFRLERGTGTDAESLISAEAAAEVGVVDPVESCIMHWHSEAYVVPGADPAHAEAVLCNGMATSLQVLAHTLTTRRTQSSTGL